MANALHGMTSKGPRRGICFFDKDGLGNSCNEATNDLSVVFVIPADIFEAKDCSSRRWIFQTGWGGMLLTGIRFGV